METITIRSKDPFPLSAIEALLAKDWTITTAGKDRVVVHGADSRAYVYIPLAVPPRSATGYELLIDYSSVELAKKVIERIADDASVTVDNDFGTILPGNEFVAKCRANQEWDWRNDAAYPR